MSFVKTICVLVGCIAYVVAMYEINLNGNKNIQETLFAIDQTESDSAIPLVSVKSLDGKRKVIVATSYLGKELNFPFRVYGATADGKGVIGRMAKEAGSVKSLQGVTILEVEDDGDSENFKHATFVFCGVEEQRIPSTKLELLDITPVAAYYTIDGNNATLVTVKLVEVKSAADTFTCKNGDDIQILAPIFDNITGVFLGIMSSIRPGDMKFVGLGKDFLKKAEIDGSP